MRNQDLHKLFVDELDEMYSSEQQIVRSLPKLIALASSSDLKEALSGHLQETKNQVKRIDLIFSILRLKPTKKPCAAIDGLLKEAEEAVKGKTRSALRDAAIISACQKVEHYEMACYGTLRSFAKHLDLGKQIIELLQETLDEEGGADKKLTKVAEGSLFFGGVNKKAVNPRVGFPRSSSKMAKRKSAKTVKRASHSPKRRTVKRRA